MSLVSLVGIRGSSFLLRLDTPVGRNTFLIVQTNGDMSFSTGFGFVPGKESRIRYIPLRRVREY